MSQRAVPIALIFVATLLLVARVGARLLDDKPAQSQVAWVEMSDAPRLAAATNRRILFFFTAEGCTDCEALESEVFADPALAEEIRERFVPVRVSDAEGAQTAMLRRRFSVRYMPSIVFSDATGNERGRMEGFRGRAEFERVMRGVR